MRSTVWMLAAAVGLSVPVLAHEGHVHVVGVVTSADAKSIEVKSDDGRTVRVFLEADTKYLVRGAAVPSSQLKVGSRVVIDADHKVDALVAREIRFIVNTPTSEAPRQAALATA